ncbi:unnamed protein product [Effrenium voratum]|nr:unnamed protein product [Effrenium voratum]
MEDDELMLCRAPSDQVEQKLSKPKLKDGFVGIRGDYYGQGPVLHMEDAGEKITSPSALSFGSTREPSCDRPDSRASACSDSFRQSRGRMLLGRTARPEDLQRPPSRGPASRGSTPPGEDLGFQQQDEEVLAILAASRRRRLEGLMVDPVSFFEAQELTRPSTATPRGSAQAQALSPRQALRSEGRNWRGVHRPPSAPGRQKMHQVELVVQLRLHLPNLIAARLSSWKAKANYGELRWLLPASGTEPRATQLDEDEADGRAESPSRWSDSSCTAGCPRKSACRQRRMWSRLKGHSFWPGLNYHG